MDLSALFRHLGKRQAGPLWMCLGYREQVIWTCPLFVWKEKSGATNVYFPNDPEFCF
jgi:hypothetical protein